MRLWLAPWRAPCNVGYPDGAQEEHPIRRLSEGLTGKLTNLLRWRRKWGQMLRRKEGEVYVLTNDAGGKILHSRSLARHDAESTASKNFRILSRSHLTSGYFRNVDVW